MSKQEYYEFLMKGAVINENDIQLIQNAKKEIDRCRPIYS
jgi:hypothetical protein